MTVRQKFIGILIILPVLTALSAQHIPYLWWLFLLWVPLGVLGLHDMIQTQRAILRLYPVIGHFRYLFESIRPEIQQYFVESDLNGTPVAREFRSLVYQRAKGQRDTRPFGTILDVNKDGYEWINHSLAPIHHHDFKPKIRFGGPDCQLPYDASPLNISAMSFGSLSKNAIMALNLGAKAADFAHNTGEGGISPYHLQGGDLIFQFGTGYFGCRDEQGNFCPTRFTEKAQLDTVKMIEIKLSQGAKPGHGGILPAVKLTQEIADIRHVSLGKDVISPAAHTAFSTPIEMMHFIKKLRDLSGGKPIGFKLCIGKKSDFISLCKAMIETGIKPDFISVDGSEGGTGAAPIELTNSVGTPIRDAIIFVNQTLIGMGLRKDIRLIASGKVISAFHLLKLIALGADAVNSARAMLFALGCIQSRSCNTDTCPTGIATQNPARVKALVVENKVSRVANYHKQMMKHLVELLGAAGLHHLSELKPEHIMHRVQGTDVQSYESMFPSIETGSLLNDATRDPAWKSDWSNASSDSW